jgi:hypothetical protein
MLCFYFLLLRSRNTVWGLGVFPMSWVIRGCLIYEISIWIYVRLMDIEGGHVMRTRFNYLSTVR